jgi:hypothetical protein
MVVQPIRKMAGAAHVSANPLNSPGKLTLPSFGDPSCCTNSRATEQIYRPTSIEGTTDDDFAQR